MTLLAYNSVPAERAAGCVFAENFESPWHIRENSGVVTGAPLINRGIELDGIGDYVTYTLQGHEVDHPEMSFLFEFYPEFNWDDISATYFYATSAPKFSLARLDAASSNVLRVQMAGTIVGTASTFNYSSYWQQGQRNQLAIISAGSSTQGYLNNNRVINSGIAWTQAAASLLYIGCDNTTVSNFYGKMTSFKMFNKKLTAEDVANYYTYGIG